MGLTVTEKEHWKERIGRRIEHAIKALYAGEDAGFLSRTKDQARRLAIESLGIATHKEREEQIEHERKALEKEKQALSYEMLAAIRGCDVSDVHGTGEWARNSEIRDAIALRQDVHERELLAETPTGQRILELRKEKEELLDTVWLATSGKQIKELWQTVTDVLSQDSTALQAEALRISPVDESQ